MSNLLFHNKFHRTIHHTVSSKQYPDSRLDPVASQDKPFLGVFYNTLVSEEFANYLQTFLGENIVGFDFVELETFAPASIVISPAVNTNSIEWHSVYATVSALSAGFEKYLTTYATVNALSSSWQDAYAFYLQLDANNPNFVSTNITVQSVSSIWEEYAYKHLTNLAQQDTKSKNFAATLLTPTSSVVWVLSANQFTGMTLSISAAFINTVAENKNKGGKYTLILKQFGNSNNNCIFSNDYIFSSFDVVSGINRENFGVTVLKFTSDGSKMYAKTEFYSLSGLLPFTYFAGDGIVLTPNPAEAVETDTIEAGAGVIIAGAVPYESATDGSINIV